MKVLIIATYELGHQPFSSLALCAELNQEGHQTTLFDLEKSEEHAQTLEQGLQQAQALLVAVPMHTATTIALELIANIAIDFPNLPIGLFGLYASNLQSQDLPSQVKLLASGEVRRDITKWVKELASPTSMDVKPLEVIRRTKEATKGSQPRLNRLQALPIAHYTKLLINGEEKLVGYTETTRGCNHKCTHCPVPVVYDGRIRINLPEWVIPDIDQLVEAGAEHITFGDPDFFNAPAHAMKVLGTMHHRHPKLTFDVTIKIEHLLLHNDLLPELALMGCVFIVSAFEHTSERVLEVLQKNHSKSDMTKAIQLCRDNSIEIRPSLLPFTPWTTPSDIKDLFEFVIENNIVANIDPVQFSIRLLVPEGSLLLQSEATSHYFIPPQSSSPLTYEWVSKFEELEVLQQELTKIAMQAVCNMPMDTFDMMLLSASNILGFDYVRPNYEALNVQVTKLSESWFCCAEPTESMLIAPSSRLYYGKMKPVEHL